MAFLYHLHIWWSVLFCVVVVICKGGATSSSSVFRDSSLERRWKLAKVTVSS